MLKFLYFYAIFLRKVNQYDLDIKNTCASIDEYINDQHRNIQVSKRKHKLIANGLQKKNLQTVAR